MDEYNAEDALLMAAEEHENAVSRDPRHYCKDCMYFHKVEGACIYLCITASYIPGEYDFNQAEPYEVADDYVCFEDAGRNEY